MNNQTLDQLEKTGCIRVAGILAILIEIPAAILGILAFFQDDLGGTGLFCLGSVILVSVLIYTSMSIGKSTKQLRKEINVFENTSRILLENIKDNEKQENLRSSAQELSPGQIGFIVGFIYGLALGMLVFFMAVGQGENIVFTIFLSLMVANISGVLGIIPAYFGWHWHDVNQAKWIGGFISACVTLIIMSLIVGDPRVGFWLGVVTSPAGWWSAKNASSYRYNIRYKQ
jgi:hypothetical protein